MTTETVYDIAVVNMLKNYQIDIVYVHLQMVVFAVGIFVTLFNLRDKLLSLIERPITHPCILSR